jgi:hypothetical protein
LGVAPWKRGALRDGVPRPKPPLIPPIEPPPMPPATRPCLIDFPDLLPGMPAPEDEASAERGERPGHVRRSG